MGRLQLTIMKKLLVLASSCFALIATAQAQNTTNSGTHFFVTPSIVVADPGDFKTAAGGAVAFGVEFARNHALQAEVISFESRENTGVKMRFTPILATYKYRFAAQNKFSFYAGLSAGITQEKLNTSTLFWMGRAGSDNAFTVGVLAGLVFKLSEHIALDANVRALNLRETRFTTEGNMSMVSFGVKFGF